MKKLMIMFSLLLNTVIFANTKTTPVFFSESLIGELNDWKLSTETLDTLQSAINSSTEQEGYSVQASDSEIESILKPKELHSLIPKHEVIIVDGKKLAGLTINFPTKEDAFVRESLATKNILAHDLAINKDQVAKIVYFIENDIFSYIHRGKNYLEASITGLAYDVEFDPDSGFYFIHFKEPIGEGVVKAVTKSLLYGIENPQIVATAVSKQGEDMAEELDVIKKLQHVDRIFHLIATPPAKIITTYYDGGQLTREKKKKFSFKEKVSLAKDLMEALAGAHAVDYVHEDIHDGNLLLEKNNDLNLAEVNYRLVLADWGKAFKVDKNTSYSKRKDIYAAGATLYSLYHNLGYEGKLYNNLNVFYSAIEKPLTQSTALLLGEISPEITARKHALDAVYKQGIITRREKFERIILHMLHPTKVETRDAAYWYHELEQLLMLY